MVAEKPEPKNWGWWILVSAIAVLVMAASYITLRKDFRALDLFHQWKHTEIVDKYADAFSIALQFFDVQKSGKLENNRISWRGNSALGDGKEENLDLSKGLYDAGDMIKFGFPMAFTATVLSWAILEYGNHMKQMKELQNAENSLRWITDFLINAHPSPNVLYVQADYVLGHNPMKMSYLVGYGSNYPQYVHHRGASIPVDANTGCSDGFKWLNSTDPNPNVATGALVGGPYLNDTYIDSRNNTLQNEPTTYNSAVLVGLLSGLVTTSSVAQSFL